MRYDLHIHTHYSKCSNLKPETILKLAKKYNLDGIAITDHHETKGALEVKKLNRDKDFEIIVGEEVSTNYGDVLIYYLSKKIEVTCERVSSTNSLTRMSHDFYEVVDEARKQGALITIAHPFRTTVIHNHKFQIPIEKIKNKIDAVECFNARMMYPSDNRKAEETADKHGIAKTAGSDSHFFFEIGNGWVIFEDDLRESIKNKKTKVGGNIRLGAFGGALSYLRKKMF